MRPNARSLALRDPARAAFLGIIGGKGSDFGGGGSSTFGAEFGAFGAFGGDSFPDESYFEGDEYGDEYGAPPHLRERGHGARVPRPSEHAMLALWHKHHMQKSRTRARVELLDPNAGSEVQVETYSMTLSQTFQLGVAAQFGPTMSGNSKTHMRPKRLTMNVPAPGFALLSTIQVSNVNAIVGPGVEDAYSYNAGGVGQSLDLPKVTPATPITITGSYTGYVPIGYNLGDNFVVTASFKGPSTVAG